MRKIFTFVMCLVTLATLNAQSPFLVSPSSMGSTVVAMYGESMSRDRRFVVGSDQTQHVPAIWYTVENEMLLIVENDSTLMDPSLFGEEGDPYWYYSVMEGSLMAVNNNGIAVGLINTADYKSHPIKVDLLGATVVEYLYEDPTDAGAACYGITDDGSIILGYHFSEDWTTYACIWTENGTVRTDLPTPTAAEVGFNVDYASARWISGDGNMILGYVQDNNTGDWVAVVWKKENGQYTVLPICHDLYQTRDFSGDPIVPANPNPYFKFEPVGFSADGNWVSLIVQTAYDVDDYDYTPIDLAARYNITDGTLEVLTTDEEYETIYMYGIANDGTCVGRFEGEMNMETYDQETSGVIWETGSTSMEHLFTRFADDEYVTSSIFNTCTYISPDGAYVLGVSINGDGEQSSYIIQVGEESSIEEQQIKMSVYPNPASTSVTVELDSEIESIMLVNMMGQVVYAESGINAVSAKVNTSNLPNGMYILRAESAQGAAIQRVSVVR